MAEKDCTRTSKIKVAFFKDTAWDSKLAKLITWWTDAKEPHNYFHTEIVFPDGQWFSAGTTNGMKTTFKPYYAYNFVRPEDIDFIELEVNEARMNEAIKFARDIEGAEYDWKGIFFSQIMNLRADDPSKWFCSEVSTRLLQIMGIYPLYFWRPNQVSPIRLYNILKEYTKK